MARRDYDEDDDELGPDEDQEDEQPEEQEEEDEEEEDEEEEERSRKRRRSQFIDDAAEEDDDEDEEEDEGPRRGKKGKTKRSMFIDDAAAVASDEEEEEEAEEEGFIHDEDLGDLPEEPTGVSRGRRPMDTWRDPEEDEQELERFIQERFGGRAMDTQYEDAETTEVEQQALLPSVKDPKLWMVRCQLGHEREAVVTLMQKYLNREAAGEPLLIKSAVALDHLKGFIYVESEREAYVKQACTGLRLLYSYKINLVPIKEMAEVLTVEKKPVELDLNSWVRVKTGLYKGDLGQVVDVDTIKQTATVKLVPRVDLEALVAKQEGNYDPKKKRTRPPPRFFSIEEVKNLNIKVTEKRDSQTYDLIDMIEGMRFKDNYFWKTVSLKTLDSKGVEPTLDELQRFQRPGEGDDQNLGLAPSIAGKQRAKLQKEDVVEVIEGDLKGLMGVVDKVDGDEIIIRPRHKDLTEPLPVKERQLRKFFRTGDHVKVIAGQHEGATGLIVKVDEQIVIILTDTSKEHIKVFSRDIVSSSEVASGPLQLGDYELHDLVMLDQMTFGVIIKVERGGCEILKGAPEKPTVQAVKLRDIRRKIFDKKATTQDCDGSLLSIKDRVRITEGTYKGKTATVEHLHRGVVFLFDRNLVENGGFFVVKARSCRALGGSRGGEAGRRLPAMSDRSAMLRSPANSLQSPYRGPQQGFGGGPFGGQRGALGRPGAYGGGRGGHRRDDGMVGRTVKIRGGPFKGYKGRIVDATDTTVRIELESQMKVVTVRRDQLPEGDPHQATPFIRESPRYGAGSETPMHPSSRTPMHPGFASMRDPMATPIHEGMRTPMRDRAWNPQVPTTPLRSDGWDDANPSTWHPPGAYSGGYQPFTPAYSPVENVPTPAESQNPSTPGMSARAYEAPTPGAGAGAGWGNGAAMAFGDGASTEAGTPYGGNAPSPYQNPSTPGGGGYPMTPGGAYVPGTPGGQPGTPGGPGPMDAATPALGGDSALVTDVVVVFTSGPDEGQQGVVRETLTDGTYRVALGSKGDGTLVTASHAEVELVQPKKNDRIKVVVGEYRGHTGKLIQVDANDAIAKMDEWDESSSNVKAFEVTDLGKLEIAVK